MLGTALKGGGSLRIAVEPSDNHGTSTSYQSKPSKLVECNYPCSKLKLDQLFLEWLSRPESQQIVTSLIEDAKAGRPIRGPLPHGSHGPHGTPAPSSPTTSHPGYAATPPLSPHKQRSPRSPLSPGRKAPAGSAVKRAPLQSIPQFYFPAKNHVPEDARATCLAQIAEAWSGSTDGLPVEKFIDAVHKVCDLPTVLGYPLFAKLEGREGAPVKQAAFEKWFLSNGLVTAPPERRMFEILRGEGRDHLVYDDFKPLMEAILKHHPGLEFLAETPEFQTRYAETVTYRIFYHLNRSGSGRLTLREIRKGDLLEALNQLDREEDINKVLKYFSYEHFYVIYCKFWELDTDHDFLIDKDDLLKYGGCSLTYRIVDRIFEQAPRRFACTVPGKMGYEDFVWFILSEEDKTTDTSLEYWFRCVDLDCDGVIMTAEMVHFYEEQAKRLESISQEAVAFEDIACQLHDMLAPMEEGKYTLRDLKRVRPQAGLLFSILCNLHKFLAFENRDPFAARQQEQEEAGLTEWERWARLEYIRLATEEEHDDLGMDTGDDVWGGAMDQG